MGLVSAPAWLQDVAYLEDEAKAAEAERRHQEHQQKQIVADYFGR